MKNITYELKVCVVVQFLTLPNFWTLVNIFIPVHCNWSFSAPIFVWKKNQPISHKLTQFPALLNLAIRQDDQLNGIN